MDKLTIIYTDIFLVLSTTQPLSSTGHIPTVLLKEALFLSYSAKPKELQNANWRSRGLNHWPSESGRPALIFAATSAQVNFSDLHSQQM